MAAGLTSDDLRRLARLGAMRRLEEIRREEAAIRSAFPELFDQARRPAGRRPGRPAKAAAAEPAPTREARGGRKKKKKMSSSARKAVSERMKKYWADRRKAKG